MRGCFISIICLLLTTLIVSPKVQAQPARDEKHTDASRLQQLEADYAAAIGKKDYAAASGHVRSALEFAEKLYGANSGKVGYFAHELGATLHRLGQNAEAELVLKRALRIREAQFGRDHINVGWTLNWLGTTLNSSGRHTDAEPYLRRVTNIIEREKGRDHLQTAYALHSWAWSLRGTKKCTDAIPLYERALRIKRMELGNDAKTVGHTLQHMAWCYDRMANYSRSEEHFRGALRIKYKTLPNGHVDIGWAEVGVGTALARLSRHTEAEHHLRKGLNILTLKFGPAYQGTIDTMRELVTSLGNAGRFDDAEALVTEYDSMIKEYFAIVGKKGIEFDRAINAVQLSLGAVLWLRGKFSESEKILAEVAVNAEKGGLADAEDYLMTLLYLGLAQHSLGKAASAEKTLRETINRVDQHTKSDSESAPFISSVVHTLLATTLIQQDRPLEAEQILTNVSKHFRDGFDDSHPVYEFVLQALGKAAKGLKKFGEAERYFKSLLAVRERRLGPNTEPVAQVLTDLGDVLEDVGKSREAIKILSRSLKIAGSLHGGIGRITSRAHFELAYVYQGLDDFEKAEEHFLRAIEDDANTSGSNSASLIVPISALAGLYRQREHFQRAERMFSKALAIAVKGGGEQSYSVAQIYHSRGKLYRDQRKIELAFDEIQKAATIFEALFGEVHADVVNSLEQLGKIRRLQKRYPDSLERLQRGLAIQRRLRSPEHPKLADLYFELGLTYNAMGNGTKAVEYITKSARHRARTSARTIKWSSRTRLEQMREHRSSFVLAALYAYFEFLKDENTAETKNSFSEGAFEMAQWAMRTSADAALAQMSARFAKGSSGLSRLVREEQDLRRLWAVLDKQYVDVLGASGQRTGKNSIPAIRAQIETVESRLEKLEQKLSEEHGEYASLKDPPPISVAVTQELLNVDEALILLLNTDKRTLVWAVSKDQVLWKQVPLTSSAIANAARALRPAFAAVTRAAPDARAASVEGPTAKQFDFVRARALYRLLLRPFEDLIGDKKHLLIVPSGPLTGLPFHLIVKEFPDPENGRFAALRNARWLIRDHALTVLPSVASLKALRRSLKREPAQQPFVGFGNPKFGPCRGSGTIANAANPQAAPTTKQVKLANAQARGVAYRSFFRGNRADTTKLCQLAQLSESADEIKKVAESLGAPQSGIILGERASEAKIKALNADDKLADYRVLHFATHGLVAGEVDGASEPGLALTVPEIPTEEDDGLLTASEVAGLKLNADWVILSACNTAAGEKGSAEALSGLARAFFYAGAKALLVSHWPVYSNAAVKLTTRAFSKLKAHPEIGRAEALRRAMLDIIDNGADHEVRPAYWAPFVVVGEGGR